MKRGRFATASQREHVRQAFKLISLCAGAISQRDFQCAYDEAMEAQRHLIVVFGIINEDEMFPKAAGKEPGR